MASVEPGQHRAGHNFLLGNLVAAKGHRVIFSHHAINHIVLNTGFVDSMRHQVRWSRVRGSRWPKGHFRTSLTFSMPFALLAFVAALCLHLPWLAAASLAWGIVSRMLLAAAVGKAVVQEHALLRTMLLFPLRDLMGFGFWVASYGSNQILWCGGAIHRGKGWLYAKHACLSRDSGRRHRRPRNRRSLRRPFLDIGLIRRPLVQLLDGADQPLSQHSLYLIAPLRLRKEKLALAGTPDRRQVPRRR